MDQIQGRSGKCLAKGPRIVLIAAEEQSYFFWVMAWILSIMSPYFGRYF